MKKEFIITILCFVLMFFGGAFSSSAKAVTYYVNSDADGPVRNGSCVNSAGCTLREAFQRAESNDEIQFASPYFDDPRTIRLTLGIPLTKGNNGTVNIYGRGADRLTIDGNNNTQIFSLDGSNGYKTLYLHQMTLANGNQSNSSTGGGAVYLRYSELKMDQVVITNCVSAGFGGAIYSSRGNVRIEHSALYNNHASGYGSAIYAFNDLGYNTSLQITNTTISGNSSPNSKGAAIYSLETDMYILFATITKNSANGGNSPGGIFIEPNCPYASCESYLNINSSIIAENPNVASPNISGTINAQAYSVIGGNPLLLPLAFDPPRVSTVRGLPTHSLDTCSPAINAGAVPPGVTSDQQYDPRVLQGRADSGARESFLLPCPTAVTVTNGSDSGAGSLRQAVNDIGLNGTINFASGVSDVVLTSGQIVINRDVNITGDGTNQITVRGSNQSRIFTVAGGKTLSLSKIILADGNASGASGGAIVNNGTLNITNSAIVNNKAQDGGGISNGGTLSLTNVTVSGNQSNGKGAGVYNNGGSTNIITVVNSTVTNNQNFGYTGAGVWNDNFSGSNTFRVRNSIIDGNLSDQGYAHDYVGDVTNQGYNLIGTRNPQLAPLGNYGGATLTHALLCGSPAVDAADPNNGNNPATDQRGAGRPVNGRADIGAVEIGICAGVVTNGGNGGAGSLRQAILDANPNGTISFASNVTGITLTGGELLINKNLTISGGTTPLVISGNDQSRVFNIASGATLNLNRVTITGGNNSGGGAVCSYGTLNATNSTFSGNNDTAIGNYGGTMTILNSTVSGNNGGGILNSATLMLLNSTVSGNQANGKGAGVYNNGGGGSAAVLNSTITDNRGFGYTGAGIWNDGGTFSVRNSIIDGNFSDQGYAHDFVGGLANLGNNLIGTRNPGLAPLGNYGGATQTHALLQNSAALNAGNNCVLTANGCGDGNAALTLDQRGPGAARKIGANVDIGAFERNMTFDQPTLPNANAGANYEQTLTVTRQTSYGEFNGNQPVPYSLNAPFIFSIVPVAGQQLPPGLSLSSGGTISGTPTTVGIYTFTVKDTDADGIASVQQYTMQIFGPTAATVSISGRVLAPGEGGLTGAQVTLTDSTGTLRTISTGGRGAFCFADVAAGETYILSIQSKRYRYAPQIITATEDMTDLRFAPQ